MAPEGDGIVVTFRDVPEAPTQGDTEAQARDVASDALRTAFEFYVEDGRPLPTPSQLLPGEVLISVDN